MPRLFDVYIMVDWSAASAPKTGKDSIWIAELGANTGRCGFSNPSTRAEAASILERRLKALTETGKRVLLGFDFSLGYPAGTAKALQLKGKEWRAMHTYLSRQIQDNDDNSNNRFDIAAAMNATISGDAEPFWGVTSKRHVAASLAPNKPTIKALPELRIVERFLRDQKLGAPKSVWQLAYIGSVGSQSLVGIPKVDVLRNKFPSAKLWPFETGFQELNSSDIPRSQIIIAEIYPSLVTPRLNKGEPLDKAQVRTIARHYWELDKTGWLGAAFAPPPGLNAKKLSFINKEEGWILGISPINIGNLAS